MSFDYRPACVRTAAAGPYTLLMQLAADFQSRKLSDPAAGPSLLSQWGHIMGHTKGADLIVGRAGQDIISDLIRFEAGWEQDENNVLETLKNNIRQALDDNEIFKGLSAEKSGDVWVNMGTKSKKLLKRRLASSYDYREAHIKKTATDLADLTSIANDWYKKQEELAKQKEEIDRQFNSKWYEANKDLEEGTRKLLNELYDAIIKYFKQTNRVIRKTDNVGGLIEIFIGTQSKVSVHLALSFKTRPYMSWRLRNENFDEDIEGKLSPNNTVGKLLAIIKKADKNGFWDGIE